MKQNVCESFAKLTPATQRKVKRIVRTYLQTCAKLGAPATDLERVHLEAIEAVRLQEMYPENEMPQIADYHHARHYAQYVSPKFAY